MTQWQYCEVDFDGRITSVYFYDEAGEYIDNPTRHPRLGIVLSQLGHDGWELVSTWWRDRDRVTYMLKRSCQQEWTTTDRDQAKEKYLRTHPRDAK
jgi:hypothetical protein